MEGEEPMNDKARARNKATGSTPYIEDARDRELSREMDLMSVASSLPISTPRMYPTGKLIHT